MPEYIRHDEGTFSSLTKQQKEAIGLLSIGTFLEYFDLMLYVHMAVVLNELFFPKFDPNVASFLSAAAFCSTYALRPFGALIFGYIGDNIGRKLTVIITTFMMAISCIIMANLPTL
ncbi:MFS transporter [Rickettsia endosymbiont of Ixodes scapularis]|uniref:MFS transporter n=1 Tax=Rickettsia endosymbiont of Ixodes scapularis TaxID=444612 RepID=UPI0026C2FB95